MNVLEQMVAEARGFLVIGIARWHYKSVGQQDYFRAYWGNLVLLHPHVSKENADLEALPEGPEKLAKWVDVLKKMGSEGQDRMAGFQRATVTAGIEGVSEAAEKCKRVEALRSEPDIAPSLAAMVQAELDFEAATIADEVNAARAAYAQAEQAVDTFVRARHICTASCFSSYRPIKFVPQRKDEDAAQNLIHPDTIPAGTVTQLFSAIMQVSDEGGRARKRIEAFRPDDTAHARHDRKALRQKAKRAHARRRSR